MISIYQGDTTDIIVLEDTSKPDLSDKNWEAELTVVDSSSGRTLIRKKFAKDLESNVFFTMLFPRETIKLPVGRYVMGYQVTNVKLGYRKEIKDKLRVKEQYVWDKNPDEFYCEIPGFCIYTKDGSFPSDMEFDI